MKKVELLSPVGSIKTLPYAIHNGADAVYLSGKNYGARKFAENFSDEELLYAVKYCHLYGVKIYVTVNTLIFDDELKSALEYIGYLHKIGVDAVIMQDIGLIKKTHELYPNLDIHASTQCHNHNDEGNDFFKKLGVTRVILDREMSLEEIKKMHSEIEKEIFIHGALCVSYSGCCLFSSMNGGRSGNRGECVASCRKKYELYKNDKKIKTAGDYLLSMKELNTINHIKELIEAGITSFKIEGRMKSSEYVALVTRIYRKMIDKYYNGEKLEIDEKDIYDLKKIYNREFTDGYLFNNNFKDIMNIKTPNHIGIRIGDVIECDKKYIKVKLEDNLNQEDGIRLPNGEGMILNKMYNTKLLLVNSLKKGDIVIIDNRVKLNEKGPVLKTLDKKLIDQLKQIIEKKILIDMKINCKLGQPIRLEISDGINKIEKIGNSIQEAQTSPTSRERIIEQVKKLGGTPFELNEIKSDIDDNIFVPIRELNELRRSLVKELISIRENTKKEIIINDQDLDSNEKDNNFKSIKINVLVRNEKQLLSCLNNGIDFIYTDSLELYNKYKNSGNIYLKIPRVNLKYKNYSNENLLLTEIGSVERYAKNNHVSTDYMMNVTNVESIKLLEKNNVAMITISPEVNIERLQKMNLFNHDVAYLVYGTIELMIMKYCPIKLLDNGDQNSCNLCDLGNKYYLKDEDNNKYPIINSKHYTHIMHKEVIDHIKEIKRIKDVGINNFRIELFEEDEDEVRYIINRVKKELGD